MKVETSTIFLEWLKNIKDAKAHTAITRRIQALRSDGHFGDHKHITGAIFELRVHTGPGYRLYVAKKGDALVILLCGGDKSTQKRDIMKAQKILDEEF